MKQIKKILCGMLLTSFVILGSVSVLANGRGQDVVDFQNGTDDYQCSQTQTVGTITENQTVSQYSETSTSMSFNAESSWGYNENQTVICS